MGSVTIRAAQRRVTLLAGLRAARCEATLATLCALLCEHLTTMIIGLDERLITMIIGLDAHLPILIIGYAPFQKPSQPYTKTQGVFKKGIF